MEMGERREREEWAMGLTHREKGVRGDEMANGKKKRSGWTTSIWETKNGIGRGEERMGKREWRKIRREKNTKGSRQSGRENKGKEKSQWRRRNHRKEKMGKRRIETRFCRDTHIGMWEKGYGEEQVRRR